MSSLIKLLRYLKPYKLFTVLGPVFMFIEVAMDLVQPMILQLIIDEGIAKGDSSYVIKMGLIMIGAAVIGLGGGIGSSIYSTKAAVNFATDIRQDVFHKIERFSGKDTDSFGTGKLITISTNDIASVQMAVMSTLRVLVRNPLLFIGSVIIVFISAREFFPILLVLIPILVLFNWFFINKAGKMFKKVQEAIDKVNTKLQENLAGVRVVKAFGRQEYEKKHFSQVNEDLTKVTTGASQTMMALMPVMLFVVNIGIVAALWMGVIKVDQGTTQVGVILAFINYLNITLTALIGSSHVLMAITRAFPSADRIFQVLTKKMEIEEAPNPLRPANIKGDVEFQHVGFSYSKNGELVLRNITFKAKSGEKIGIIGSIGSGKTTMIKLISRLYDVDSGQILIDGRDIREYDLQSLRASIGFVPQKPILFSGSIQENITFGNESASSDEIKQTAASANAEEFINHLEDGYKHVLTQGGSNLSGGQKQRLSIARALLRRPAILILDDSTSAVDALSEKAILKALHTDFYDTTTFMIASKISSIKHMDQILVMEDGSLAGIGTHQELLKTCPVYQEIYLTQGGKEGILHESASS